MLLWKDCLELNVLWLPEGYIDVVEISWEDSDEDDGI